jgi:hypothetical protein
MVEENEGADHAPLGGWQDASDLEAAEVAPPLLDHEIQHFRLPDHPAAIAAAVD